MSVTIEAFDSPLLVGNPLGDPTLRRVPVYVSDGLEPGARVPLLFALAGFMGTGLSMLRYDFYQPNLPELLDALVQSGELPRCVVVMVDGMTRLGGNQYIDSSAVGPWARHICEELVPWAEARLPVLRGREHRGVFGISSGGYGAFMMGAEQSETFSGVAMHSGDCYFDYCYLPDLISSIEALRKFGGLEGFWGSWRGHDRLPGVLVPAINIVAMSAFYSPNPLEKLGFDLPFDEGTGELRPEVFARWRARDPVNLVGKKSAALRSLRHLHVECGLRDEYHLQHGARVLHARLEQQGVPHSFDLFDDGHRGLMYRYKSSLPALVRALG